MSLHGSLYYWEEKYCHGCNNGQCSCPCDFCRGNQAWQEERRRQREAKEEQAEQRRQGERQAMADRAKAFLQEHGEEPCVVSTGTSLHRHDCPSVRTAKNVLMVTMDQATAWLHDPAWTLPSYHAPRSLCGTCFGR